jgi:hypothetical protein
MAELAHNLRRVEWKKGRRTTEIIFEQNEKIKTSGDDRPA